MHIQYIFYKKIYHKSVYCTDMQEDNHVVAQDHPYSMCAKIFFWRCIQKFQVQSHAMHANPYLFGFVHTLNVERRDTGTG